MRLFILITLFPILCLGTVPYSPMTYNIDPAFLPLLTDFILFSDGKVSFENTKRLTMRFNKLTFSETGEGQIGVCYKTIGFLGANYQSQLEVDITYWQEASYLQKTALLFHELGHCICNRGHVEDDYNFILQILDVFHIAHVRGNRFPDGCPMSLMHPTDLPERCLQDHLTWYVHELFKTCEPNTPMNQTPFSR